jgi:peptidoglycan/xylan/chitin deacetylase (PgdA/CDA1 family)
MTLLSKIFAATRPRLTELRKLTVLMYHNTGPAASYQDKSFFIQEDIFEKQLEYIKKSGFVALGFDEVEEATLLEKQLPPRSIMLTFDDGWLDNYTYAFPLLKKHNIKANIFLSVGLVGQNNMLAWSQIEEMRQSRLVEFASHGLTHKRLRSLTDDDCLAELIQSKTILEQKLGRKILSFAYPYGSCDVRARVLVKRAGYIVDYGTKKGFNLCPPFADAPMRRAHIMRGQSMRTFARQIFLGV